MNDPVAEAAAALSAAPSSTEPGLLEQAMDTVHSLEAKVEHLIHPNAVVGGTPASAGLTPVGELTISGAEAGAQMQALICETQSQQAIAVSAAAALQEALKSRELGEKVFQQGINGGGIDPALLGQFDAAHQQLMSTAGAVSKEAGSAAAGESAQSSHASTTSITPEPSSADLPNAAATPPAGAATVASMGNVLLNAGPVVDAPVIDAPTAAEVVEPLPRESHLLLLEAKIAAFRAKLANAERVTLDEFEAIVGHVKAVL